MEEEEEVVKEEVEEGVPADKLIIRACRQAADEWLAVIDAVFFHKGRNLMSEPNVLSMPRDLFTATVAWNG